MLRIIGWMGCVYLFVKALELFGNAKHRQDPDGEYETFALVGGSISLIASGIFLYFVTVQFNEVERNMGSLVFQ